MGYEASEPIYYHTIQCPEVTCRSTDCPSYCKVGKIRYHRCRECDLNFKSVQAPLIKPIRKKIRPTVDGPKIKLVKARSLKEKVSIFNR